MLKQLSETLWVCEERIRFSGLPTRHRMTVVRLSSGGLLLHSPTALSAQLLDELARLGPILAIVAPSWWHDLHLAEWQHAVPSAAMYGAPDLVRAHPTLPFTDELGDTAPALWSADLQQHHVEGIGFWLDEIAFYHPASRSLILTDLLHNYDADDARITRTIGRLVGGGPGFRFPALYRPVVDERRFRASIEHLWAWDFSRIIIGHGAILERNAREAFRATFRWLWTA